MPKSTKKKNNYDDLFSTITLPEAKRVKLLFDPKEQKTPLPPLKLDSFAVTLDGYKAKLTIDDSPDTIIRNYINCLMGVIFDFTFYKNKCLTNDDNYYIIILELINAILKYNNCIFKPFTQPINYKIIDGDVYGGEICYFNYDNDKLVFYFSKPKLLNLVNCIDSFTIDYCDDSLSTYEKYGINYQPTYEDFNLIAIADHTASHLLSFIYKNEVDFAFHSDFKNIRTQYYTILSMLSIKVIYKDTINKNILNVEVPTYDIILGPNPLNFIDKITEIGDGYDINAVFQNLNT